MPPARPGAGGMGPAYLPRSGRCLPAAARLCCGGAPSRSGVIARTRQGGNMRGIPRPHPVMVTAVAGLAAALSAVLAALSAFLLLWARLERKRLGFWLIGGGRYGKRRQPTPLEETALRLEETAQRVVDATRRAVGGG